MSLSLRSLLQGVVLGLMVPCLVQAEDAWIMKTPEWELSKAQYESALTVKGTDPKTLTTPAQRRPILQDLYIRESLLQQALKQGLDKKPQIEQQLEEMRKDLLARSALEAHIDQNAPDFTQRAQELYQARLATVYTFPLRLKLQLIQINTPSPESQTKTKQQLETLRQDLQHKKLTFEQAVEQYSQAADKALTQAGEWYKADQLPSVVFDAGVQLKDSEPLSTVLNADKAMYLVKYLERREPEVLSFDQVKDELIASLKTEYRLGQQQVLLQQLRQQFEQNAQLNDAP